MKGTNAFLAFCGKEDKRAAEPNCIRCGKCINACPMHLMPMMMNAYGNAGELDQCVKLGAMDCIECGSCSYVCPARIQLVQRFRLTKGQVMAERMAAKAKADAEAAAKKAEAEKAEAEKK